MAKKPISMPDELVKIIGKAKREILICFSGFPTDWQQKSVSSAIIRALDRGVRFRILVGPIINPGLNPVYQFLKFRARIHDVNVVMYMAAAEPIVSFILVDEKDFIFGDGLPRLGDRLSGNYLRNKFADAVTRSKPINFKDDKPQ